MQCLRNSWRQAILRRLNNFPGLARQVKQQRAVSEEKRSSELADLSKLPLPRSTPETKHFWDGTSNGELRLQRCDECARVYFPPRPFCPHCACRSVSVFKATGRATLYSYVINHRPHPAFDGPYSIAVVELEEGPRMMTNIVDTAQTPEALRLDMPLQVTFTKITQKVPQGGTVEVSLPHFKPVEG